MPASPASAICGPASHAFARLLTPRVRPRCAPRPVADARCGRGRISVFPARCRRYPDRSASVNATRDSRQSRVRQPVRGQPRAVNQRRVRRPRPVPVSQLALARHPVPGHRVVQEQRRAPLPHPVPVFRPADRVRLAPGKRPAMNSRAVVFLRHARANPPARGYPPVPGTSRAKEH